MAFDNACTKAILSASPGPTPKRCELPLFLAALGQAALGQAVCDWKALDLGSLNMQFQQDWPEDRKITALLIFLPENLKNFAQLSFIMHLWRDLLFFFSEAPEPCFLG